ncbi:MAG: ATP-binding protein [Acidobacteria bacterium]|nr:MAG: ATP-binding protein [Acidobacteriota bacterium]
MTAEPRVYELNLESDLKNVEAADEMSRRASSTAGFDEDDRQRIEMAVHESLINAIWHGNKNDASKHVWVKFEIFADRLEVRVRDQGNGFDPTNIPNPLAEENLLSISGRGIFLIKSFMDDFRVEKAAGGGTEVTMIKRVVSKPKST